jgi:hypothetical protein
MRSDNEIPTVVGSRDISSLQAKCIVQQPDHEAFYLTVYQRADVIGALWSEQSKRLGAHNLSGKRLRRIVV